MNAHIRNLLKSPKTTVAGIAAILGALGTIVRAASLDWMWLLDVDTMSAPLLAIVTGIGLLYSADQGINTPPESKP